MKAKHGEPMAYLLKHMNSGCCFPWPYAKQSAGYPHLAVNGRTTLASRIACEMQNGPPPDENSIARHTCGLGHLGCFNAGCLQWGTFKQNTADMRGHGTMAIGEKVGTSKLTAAQVDEIRSMIGGVPQSIIGFQFGISQSQVSNIKLGKRWQNA